MVPHVDLLPENKPFLSTARTSGLLISMLVLVPFVGGVGLCNCLHCRAV
jgi:hypothetical protein